MSHTTEAAREQAQRDVLKAVLLAHKRAGTLGPLLASAHLPQETRARIAAWLNDFAGRQSPREEPPTQPRLRPLN